MKKTLIIDWNENLVKTWFNSPDKSSFSDEVSKISAFNKLDEIDVTCIYADNRFRKGVVCNRVTTYLKKLINNYKAKQEGEVNVYVFRGCTPIGNIDLKHQLDAYAKSQTDHDNLIRFNERAGQHFTCNDPHFVLPEVFFNECFDSWFEKLQEKKTLSYCHFYESEYLTTKDMIETAKGFFPADSVVVPKGIPEKYRLINIEDANEYMEKLMSENKINAEPVSDSAQAIIEFSTNQLIEFLKQTI